MFDRHIGGRHRGRQRDVHRTCTLRGGAGEIQRHRVVPDLQRHLDLERFVHDPVIVEEILSLPSAIGQAFQFGTHQRFGAVAQGFERGADRLGPVFIKQFVHPPYAQIERAHLAVQIAHRGLRQTRVAQQNVDDVLIDLARRGELDRRQHEGFLKHLRGGGVVVAGHIAAHVMPMPDGSEIAEQCAVPVVGPHQPHVAQVRAADMGIVEDIDVTVLQIPIGGGFLDHRLHGKGHHPDKDRQAGLALHQGIPRHGMIETMTGVMRFGDDGVEGGAEQGRVHFVGDLFHPTRQDGKRDRINLRGRLGAHAFAFASAMSFQTSCRVIFPPTSSKRSINRMPSKDVPSSQTPWSVPRA